MNCRRFEEGWNELLDSRPGGSSGLERALEAHASACERCRGVSARYRVLRKAASVLRPPPRPSVGSLERLYGLTVPPTPTATVGRRSWRWHWAPLASAAALLVVACLVEIGLTPERLAERPVSAPGLPVVAARPLETALAEATEATLDLAKQASAPASRIGREILDLGKVSTSPPVGGAEPELGSEDGSSPPEVLRSVGERLTAGVRPISGSARHAFSFLLGPPPEPTPAARGEHGSL